MKARTAFLIMCLIVAIGASIKNHNLRKENKKLKTDKEILLSENVSMMAESRKYKVSDSLNAAKVSQLELSLTEYKKYRQEDLKLINNMQLNKRDIDNVITAQSQTINSLKAELIKVIKQDTLKGYNNINTVKYFTYNSKWTDVNGKIENNNIELQINNRESLKLVETIKYKRFLGFLWKTNKVKSRQIDVVSENPNTEIINCEYIAID